MVHVGFVCAGLQVIGDHEPTALNKVPQKELKIFLQALWTKLVRRSASIFYEIEYKIEVAQGVWNSTKAKERKAP